MKKTKPHFEKYVFVCENERTDEPCCGKAGQDIRQKFKDLVKKRGLSHRIRVSRAGCLDVCRWGPNILIAPDYIWYQDIKPDDIEKILDEIVRSLP